jgi:sortase A
VALVLACVAALGGSCGGRSTTASLGPVPGFAMDVAPSTVAPSPDAAPASAGVASSPSRADPFAGTRPAAIASRPGLEVTGQIEIPRIGLVHTTYEGNTLGVIDHGPSHWPGTAMPGDTGNTVFAGHRVTHTHPFLDLDLLQPGDSVVFTTAAGRFAYVVDETIIVTPNQLWIVDPTPTATFTIFGCHPKHQKTHRIVVRGHLVAADRNPQAASGAQASPPGQRQSPPSPPASPPPSTTTTTTPPPSSDGNGCSRICIHR